MEKAGRALRCVLLVAVVITMAACAKGPSGVEDPDVQPSDVSAMDIPPIAIPPVGAIITADGRVVGNRELLPRLADADYILLGEGHDSACDHAMQARVVGLMGNGGLGPAVGFEMVDHTRQPMLTPFNDGRIAPTQLDAHLDWPRTWGYPFELYRPIFEAMARHSLPAVALNAPRHITRAIVAKGVDGLDDEERTLIAPAMIGPVPAQRGELEAVFEMHPHTGADEMTEAERTQRFNRFMAVQSAWDSTMAWQAVLAHEELRRPVVIIAGNGHVEYGWGIAHRLAVYAPNARLLSIAPWRGPGGGQPAPDPAAANLFVYCPPEHRSSLGMTLRQTPGGVLVTSVTEDTRAAMAGLASGDVLVGAGPAGDVQPVTELTDLHAAGFAAHEAGRELVFTVLRDGLEVDVVLGRLGNSRTE